MGRYDILKKIPFATEAVSLAAAGTLALNATPVFAKEPIQPIKPTKPEIDQRISTYQILAEYPQCGLPDGSDPNRTFWVAHVREQGIEKFKTYPLDVEPGNCGNRFGATSSMSLEPISRSEYPDGVATIVMVPPAQSWDWANYGAIVTERTHPAIETTPIFFSTQDGQELPAIQLTVHVNDIPNGTHFWTGVPAYQTEEGTLLRRGQDKRNIAIQIRP